MTATAPNSRAGAQDAGMGHSGGDAVGARPGAAHGERKRPGRPPGRPKTGGRQPGTPNKATELGREMIRKRSNSIPFLCDVSAGRKFLVGDPDDPKKRMAIFPTADMRLTAAKALAPMLVPTMKAVEVVADVKTSVTRIESVIVSATNPGG